MRLLPKYCGDVAISSNSVLVLEYSFNVALNLFNKLLKSEQNVQVTVLELLDKYIDIIPKEKLKLIYVSSATSCKYIENVQTSHGDKMDDFGIINYDDIPVLFAGRPLNGTGVIDNYSKIRLMNAVKKYIK